QPRVRTVPAQGRRRGLAARQRQSRRPARQCRLAEAVAGVLMTFLTPLGALVALAVVVPLVAFFFAERGRRHVAAVLALTDVQGLSRRAAVVALLSIAFLLGLAATQPTLVHKSAHKVRNDAAAFFVIDTSRSMLASNGPTAPTRFERASKLAVEVRDKLPDIRVG